jgi:fructose-bisphosphate aldolase class II
MGIWLKMEIGINGGDGNGANGDNIDPEKRYTTPEQVWSVYKALSKVGTRY